MYTRLVGPLHDGNTYSSTFLALGTVTQSLVFKRLCLVGVCTQSPGRIGLFSGIKVVETGVDDRLSVGTLRS